MILFYSMLLALVVSAFMLYEVIRKLIKLKQKLLDENIKLNSEYLQCAIKRANAENLLSCYKTWIDIIADEAEKIKKEVKSKKKKPHSKITAIKWRATTTMLKDEIMKMWNGWYSNAYIAEKFWLKRDTVRKAIARRKKED